MKNYVQSDDPLEFTAPVGGVTSGVPVQIGNLLVVAAVTVLAGVRFVGKTRGVFSYTKAASQAWAEGAIVYWDGTAFTTVAAGNFQAGVAVVATGAGAGETTGVVRLDGIARPDEDT